MSQVDVKKVVDRVCDTLFDSKELRKIMSMCVCVCVCVCFRWI